MVLAPWYHTGTNVSRKPTPPCEVGLSPVCCCGALPQPRSSRIAAALTRALSLSLASAMPPSVLMAIGVYALASDRTSISRGSVFFYLFGPASNTFTRSVSRSTNSCS